jgi:hypothetical protein
MEGPRRICNRMIIDRRLTHTNLYEENQKNLFKYALCFKKSKKLPKGCEFDKKAIESKIEDIDKYAKFINNTITKVKLTKKSELKNYDYLTIKFLIKSDEINKYTSSRFIDVLEDFLEEISDDVEINFFGRAREEDKKHYKMLKSKYNKEKVVYRLWRDLNIFYEPYRLPKDFETAFLLVLNNRPLNTIKFLRKIKDPIIIYHIIGYDQISKSWSILEKMVTEKNDKITSIGFIKYWENVQVLFSREKGRIKEKLYEIVRNRELYKIKSLKREYRDLIKEIEEKYKTILRILTKRSSNLSIHFNEIIENLIEKDGRYKSINLRTAQIYSIIDILLRLEKNKNGTIHNIFKDLNINELFENKKIEFWGRFLFEIIIKNLELNSLFDNLIQYFANYYKNKFNPIGKGSTTELGVTYSYHYNLLNGLLTFIICSLRYKNGIKLEYYLNMLEKHVNYLKDEFRILEINASNYKEHIGIYYFKTRLAYELLLILLTLSYKDEKNKLPFYTGSIFKKWLSLFIESIDFLYNKFDEEVIDFIFYQISELIKKKKHIIKLIEEKLINKIYTIKNIFTLFDIKDIKLNDSLLAKIISLLTEYLEYDLLLMSPNERFYYIYKFAFYKNNGLEKIWFNIKEILINDENSINLIRRIEKIEEIFKSKEYTEELMIWILENIDYDYPRLFIDYCKKIAKDYDKDKIIKYLDFLNEVY